MKQYVIDQFSIQEYQALKNRLEDLLGPAQLGGIYWLPLPQDILTETQASHGECSPHVLALDLEEGRLSCELLVRTQATMKCACMGYATQKQRDWVMATIDSLLEEVGIIA